jgi:hypothetical protein
MEAQIDLRMEAQVDLLMEAQVDLHMEAQVDLHMEAQVDLRREAKVAQGGYIYVPSLRVHISPHSPPPTPTWPEWYIGPQAVQYNDWFMYGSLLPTIRS